MPKELPQDSGARGRSAAMAAGRLIGAAARARRVVLFGSAARGEAGRDSDWDFLVVLPARCHRHKAVARGWRAVRESGVKRPALDILAVREREVARERDCQYSVIKRALDEGVEVWRA